MPFRRQAAAAPLGSAFMCPLRCRFRQLLPMPLLLRHASLSPLSAAFLQVFAAERRRRFRHSSLAPPQDAIAARRARFFFSCAAAAAEDSFRRLKPSLPPLRRRQAMPRFSSSSPLSPEIFFRCQPFSPLRCQFFAKRVFAKMIRALSPPPPASFSPALALSLPLFDFRVFQIFLRFRHFILS